MHGVDANSIGVRCLLNAWFEARALPEHLTMRGVAFAGWLLVARALLPPPMIGPYTVHGYAIVSADDRIAGPDGRMPRELYNDKDWARFQAALGRAAVSVLGRLGHEQNVNKLGRNRLVMSSAAQGLEQRRGGLWWNPADVPVAAALRAAAPAGGLVVVVGGRRVFDYFLAAGYDEFHLTRMARVLIPGGVAVFSEVDAGRSAEAILAARGLVPGPGEWLDRDTEVTLAVWKPRAA
jgi:hypothetical protein